MNKCIFCEISQEKIKAERIIYENSEFFSVPDISPVTEGHSLIISKKHFKTILDLQNSLGSELIDCIKNTALKIINETGSEGFNVINNNFEVAGQAVHHVHFHIIPRKKGDGLKLN